MPVRTTPIFIQGNSHPAEETRLMLAGMLGSVTGSFAGGVAASDPAHGVVRATDLAVTQNGTPNMSVNVAAGGCFIRGTQSANQGAYHLWNDGTLNVGLLGSDATNPRRDLIVAQVRDLNYSGALKDALITVVTGTPAASPSDPAVPANSLVLARIAVGAGVSSILTANITDLRPIANIAGKMPTFTTAALASTAIPSPVDGQAYYLNTGTATEGPQYWNGSAYRPPWNMPWGVVGRALITGSTSATTAVTVTGSTITYTQVANRVYKYSVTGHASWVGGSVNDGLRVLITDGAGASYVMQDYLSHGQSTSYGYGIGFSWYETAAASGSVTRELRVGRFFGSSGSVTFFADANRIGSLIIEDIGPAGAPA